MIGNELVLPPIDSVVVSVSHAAVPGIEPELTHTIGLKNLMSYWNSRNDLMRPSSWCYVSTTGVYAPRDDGGWVDEISEVRPLRAGSKAAYAAEQWIQQTLFEDSNVERDQQVGGAMLRAAGIYGPGRVPRLDSLRNNEPLEIDPESYLNLIHVVDLAGIIVAVCVGCLKHRLYNVADGNPVKRRDYYEFIAHQVGTAPPRFTPSSPLSSGKVLDKSGESNLVSGPDRIPVHRSRGEGSKRINTDRLQKELGFSLKYPDFREGLTPLLF